MKDNRKNRRSVLKMSLFIAASVFINPVSLFASQRVLPVIHLDDYSFDSQEMSARIEYKMNLSKRIDDNRDKAISDSTRLLLEKENEWKLLILVDLLVEKKLFKQAIELLSIVKSHYRSEAYKTIYESWSVDHVNQALLSALTEKNKYKRGAMLDIVFSNWAADDPEGAASWIDASPLGYMMDYGYHNLLFTIIEALAGKDLQKAKQWTLSIRDKEARRRAIKRFSSRWTPRSRRQTPLVAKSVRIRSDYSLDIYSTYPNSGAVIRSQKELSEFWSKLKRSNQQELHLPEVTYEPPVVDFDREMLIWAIHDAASATLDSLVYDKGENATVVNIVTHHSDVIVSWLFLYRTPKRDRVLFKLVEGK